MVRKKMLALSLAAAMTAGLLGGCGQSTDTKVSESTAKSSESSVKEETTSTGENQSEAGGEGELYSWPLVDEPITLTVFSTNNGYIQDEETHNLLQYYEEMTGVHIEWILSDDKGTDMNLMIASGENVDLWLTTFSTSQVQTMVEAGMLLSLNDLIDEYGYYTKQAFDEYPFLVDAITSTDGNIYTLFETDCGVHMPNRRKMFVKSDWLAAYREAVGNENAPETVEEFEEMLVYFRDNDMNGNGLKDEIPLMGSSNGEDDPIYYLMSAFQQISNSFYHMNENGEIVFEANTEEFKEGLRWMNHLYEEGLFLAEDTYVQDRDTLRATVNMADPSNYVVGSIPSFWEGRFVDSNILKWTDFEPIAPIAGEDGVRRATITTELSTVLCSAISTTCEYPEVAMKWLDWWISEEGCLANNRGVVEGEDYEINDTPAISGADTSYTILKNAYSDNVTFGPNVVPSLDRQEVRYGVAADEASYNANNTYVLHRAGKMYEPYYVPSNIPTIVWCDDVDLESSVSEYASIINDIVKNAYTEFILGIRDIDADWDAYLSDLESGGLEYYLEILSQYYSK